MSKKVRLLYRAAEDTDLDYLSEMTSSTTENVGRGGVCFETEIYVPPNSILEVQISKTVGRRKAASPIRTNAKVIWIRQVKTRKYKLGLEFVGIDDKLRDEIVRSVKEETKR